jgi:HD-GYP domain-containing protein (c-di-GMP phosphodiesterase class II)
MSERTELSSSPMRRIKVGEVQVGSPLRFDVFDSENRLLLRRGNRIMSESQLARLVEQGIFHAGSRKGEATRGVEMPSDCVRPAAPALEVSTVRMLEDCARSLDELLRTRSPVSDAGRFVDQIRLLATRIQQLCRSDSDAALAYALLGQAPQYAVRQHINVAILSALMLSRLTAQPVRAETAVCAALTMNIGKLELHEELYWVDRRLDEGERAELQQHPIASVQMLRSLGVEDADWLQIVEQHHEALDGSGYPHRIGGAQVCTEARIIAIADRYNGMVMNRAYRRGIAPDSALRELARRDARATDPALVGLLIKVIGVYPPGTVVALVNKEVGVVTKRLLDLKHPLVHTFFLDPDWPYDKPIKRFTGRMPQFAVAKTLSRDDLNLTIDLEALWPPVSLLEPLVAA